MKYIKKFILLLFVAAAVVLFGMIALDWKVAGYSWTDVQSKLFPTKKALEEKRGEYIDRAFKEAESQ